MRKASLTLLGGLLLAGCGYRAPMHQSYLPVVTGSTLYAGIRPDYQQLAALMEKDTGMKPVEGNTVSLVFEGQENLDKILEEVKRWPSPCKWRNWILRILGGPLA